MKDKTKDIVAYFILPVIASLIVFGLMALALDWFEKSSF